VRFIKYNMSKQKQYSWRLVSKLIGSGFLSVTMFLTPSFVFADYTITTTSATDGLYSLGAGQHTNLYELATTTTAGTVSSGSVCLYKQTGQGGSSATGTYTVAIYAVDANSKPTGAALATQTLNVSGLPGPSTCSDISLSFSSPATVSASTVYAIAISRSATDGYVSWSGDSTDTTHFNDGYSDDSGSSWTRLQYTLRATLDVTTAVASTTTTLCDSIFGTTTGCTYQVVDYPVLDYFLGIVLFLFVAGWTATYFNRLIHH